MSLQNKYTLLRLAAESVLAEVSARDLRRLSKRGARSLFVLGLALTRPAELARLRRSPSSASRS